MAPYGIIFDLDGTLVDSVPGLTHALNVVAQARNLKVLTEDDVRRMVGQGAWNLSKRCLEHVGVEPTEDHIREFGQAFLEAYESTWRVGTPPFEHIEHLLRTLTSAGIPCSILTNKPQLVTNDIIRELFHDRGIPLSPVYGASDRFPRKPDITGIHHIARDWDIPLDHLIFVGDSEIDALTAQKAGIPCLLVDWGYQDHFLDITQQYNAEPVHSVDDLLKRLLSLTQTK